ncbi:hypothetical protein [Scytonema sp. NUACC26]|uniref:hypothetical protein n=1 Tax=Scytonema sp. NUACC26 TaxID=3140176 RepID=UPI0034DC0B9B
MTDIYFTASGDGKVLLNSNYMVIQLPHEHDAEELADALNETIEVWMSEYEDRKKKRYGLYGHNNKYTNEDAEFRVFAVLDNHSAELDSKCLFWDSYRKMSVILYNNFFYRAECIQAHGKDCWKAKIEISNIIE